MRKYDVIVVGGGFAGVGAALAAARENRKVLLIEQGGALGGAAINSLVMPFMPYYTNILKEDGTVERKFLSRWYSSFLRNSVDILLCSVLRRRCPTLNNQLNRVELLC